MKNFLSTTCCSVNKLFFASVLLLTTTANDSAIAQGRWSADLRTGVNVATKKFANTSLKTGFGFEGNVSFRLMPHLWAYTGWGWNQFSAKEPVTDRTLQFEETGYNLGLRFIHPLPHTKVSYVVGAGAIYNHVETEDSKGDIIHNTGHGLGWQADAGISVPVAKRLRLVPGVRYRSLSRKTSVNGIDTRMDLQYFSGGASILWQF